MGMNRDLLDDHRNPAHRRCVAVMAGETMKVVVHWRCDRCQAQLTTYTRLSQRPTHRCGSKQKPTVFISDDYNAEQKALQ